jgi:hypothetical protein
MTYPFGCANITDFQYFVYTVMGVPASALPIVAPATVNPDVAVAFQLGCDTVNPFIRQVSPHYYNLALYNLFCRLAEKVEHYYVRRRGRRVNR